MEYVFILLAALCIGVQFNVNKIYGKVSPKGIIGTLMFPFIATFVSALVVFCVNLFKIKFTWFGILMATIGSVISVISLMVGILATGRGRVGVYTTFMMLGGMFLPYMYGLFTGDSITVGKIIGMVVLIGALIMSVLPSKEGRESKQPIKVSFIILCSIAFILNGCTSIISNIHQKNVALQMPTFDYVITSNLFQFVLAGIALLVAFIIIKNKQKKNCSLKNEADTTEKETKSSSLKTALIILGVCSLFAIVSTGGFLLQLIANKTLEPSLLYPFVTGGSTVFGTLIAAVMFKEKINLPTIISLSLMVVGTVLFIF